MNNGETQRIRTWLLQRRSVNSETLRIQEQQENINACGVHARRMSWAFHIHCDCGMLHSTSNAVVPAGNGMCKEEDRCI